MAFFTWGPVSRAPFIDSARRPSPEQGWIGDAPVRFEMIRDAVDTLRHVRDAVAAQISPRARIHLDLAIDALHRDYEQKVLDCA